MWQIDGVSTIIDSVHGNYAVGFILNNDFTLKPCYIAKCGNSFAHGSTLKAAIKDAADKELENTPLEQRIEKFRNDYPETNTKIPARSLYDWHHILTGSCRMGRDEFARQHGINVDKDSFTVSEFVMMTKDHYGSDAIRKLAEAYNIKL